MTLNNNIVATDALRDIGLLGYSLKDIYKTFITRLKTQGTYNEYQVNGIPERRNSQCQAEQQRSDKPTLFIFAYDWRLGNSENADKLYEYVQCVQQFYPGTKVNIVAHSQGGLIARRYLLDYSLNHQVDNLITIGSPWLGAPRALETLLTGRFIPIAQGLDLYWRRPIVQRIALNSKGIHQLLPSRWYFNLGGRPFKEEVDANGDGIYPQVYENHSMLFNWINSSPPFNAGNNFPYRNSVNFHDYPSADSQSGQDDWRQDTVSGVNYTHIYGQQFGQPDVGEDATTLSQVIITGIRDRTATDVRRRYYYGRDFDLGDGTVPTLSASRRNLSQSIISPQSINRFLFSTDRGENYLYEHNGLMKNQEVMDIILSTINSSSSQSNMVNTSQNSEEKEKMELPKPLSPETLKFELEFSRKLRKQAQDVYNSPGAPVINFQVAEKDEPQTLQEINEERWRLETAINKELHRKSEVAKKMSKTELEEFHRADAYLSGSPLNEFVYLNVAGVARLEITDQDGKTNTSLGAVDLAVPGVDYEYGSEPGEDMVVPHEVKMPGDKSYDVKFQVGTDGLQIEILKGYGRKVASKAIRYLDLRLPAGVRAWLRFTPQGIENLRYDADGDGVYESTVTPTYSVTDQAARDLTAPNITINSTVAGNTATISVTATDDETGVSKIYYALGNGAYQLYTAPFSMNLLQNQIVHVSAEDNAGNYRLAYKVFDFTPPATSAQVSPSPSANGWNNSPVDVNLQSADNSGGIGVQEITYRASGVAPIPENTVNFNQLFSFPKATNSSETFSTTVRIGELAGEGITTLTYFAKDKSGNTETPKTLDIKLDYTAPRSQATVNVNLNTANISLAATDFKMVYNPQTETYEPNPNFPVSGVAAIKYSIDGGTEQTYTAPFVYTGSAGLHTLSFHSVDKAGNIEETKSTTFTLTDPPIANLSVKPVLECVSNNTDGTYTAKFGYLNSNSIAVNIPVGANNKFTPSPQDRGQVTNFQTGRIRFAFNVVFNGSNLVWTLKGPDNQGRTSTASSSSARCQ